MKLPVVRKVAKAVTVKDSEGEERSLEENQTVICDVVSSVLANSHAFTPLRYKIANRTISPVPRVPSQRGFHEPGRLPHLRLVPQRRPRQLQRQRNGRPRAHGDDQSLGADEEPPSRPRHPRHAQEDQHRPDLRGICQLHGSGPYGENSLRSRESQLASRQQDFR